MNTDTNFLAPPTTGSGGTRHIPTEHDTARHGVNHGDFASNNTEPSGAIITSIKEHRASPSPKEPVSHSFAPTDDISRHDTIERVTAGQDAPQDDEARQVTPERDATRHDVTSNTEEDQPAENWVDIQQAETLLRKQGVSRTTRTIQRFCQKGDLESRLVPTETGSRYIINERSIEALAKRLRETLPGNSFSTKENEHVAGPSADQKFGDNYVSPRSATDDAHMREVVDLKDQHISMLQNQLAIANNQIAVKDEQFAAMIERDHETNILIQNLQRMVGLPEAKPQTDERHTSIDIDRERTQNFKQAG